LACAARAESGATMTNFLLAAQYYQRLNIPIFPVHSQFQDGRCSCRLLWTCPNKGKHPRITGFHEYATTDAGRIGYWASIWPHSNVGMPTGHPWPYVVIDVDPRHGGERSLDDLQRKCGLLPPTIETITGSGGRHFFFKTPSVGVQNSAGRVAAGIDVRGYHGFVIVPPSLHISGSPYKWAPGRAPDEIAAADMPAWLLELITTPIANSSDRRFNWRVLAGQKINEGERNSAIASFAGHLLRRKVDPYLTVELILSWNGDHCIPPLDDFEVVRVVDSIAKSELARRKRPR